jgi:hypothetical protein
VVKGKTIPPGNTEYLIDAANYCMIEFLYPKHPDAFFRPTDSDESNGRQWNNGVQTDAAHGGAAKNAAVESFYKGRTGD